jgi:hypothetical protein
MVIQYFPCITASNQAIQILNHHVVDFRTLESVDKLISAFQLFYCIYLLMFRIYYCHILNGASDLSLMQKTYQFAVSLMGN